MRVEGNHQSWKVDDADSLTRTLALRDSRGGASFWLAHENKTYPCLAIRITGEIADIHFFPEDGHPGFRCLGGDGLPEGKTTAFVYEGCDPSSGEETLNKFIVPVSVACSIATRFFQREEMPDSVSWFEL